MIEFSEWAKPYNQDAMFTIGRWCALVRYASGRWKFEFCAVTAQVSQLEIYQNDEAEALQDIFSYRIRNAVDKADAFIRKAANSKIMVKEKHGRKKGRVVDRILWMSLTEAQKLTRMSARNKQLYGNGIAA